MLLHVKVAAQTSGVLHCLLLHAVSIAWPSMHTSQLRSQAFGRVQTQLQLMTSHLRCMHSVRCQHAHTLDARSVSAYVSSYRMP